MGFEFKHLVENYIIKLLEKIIFSRRKVKSVDTIFFPNLEYISSKQFMIKKTLIFKKESFFLNLLLFAEKNA